MAVSQFGAIGASQAGAIHSSDVGATRLRPSVRGRSAVGAGVALAASVLLAVPARGAVTDPDFHIVIRTYDATTAVNGLSTTMATAAAILEDAGVGVTWVSCEAVFVRRDENPCLAPLAANELAVRFIRLSPRLAEQDLVTLGDSLVDTHLGTGSLATIYVNRVVTLAARCGMDTATLMGRAVAHEIGHLLLGTVAHASAGLMRASWSQTALRRADGDWTFTKADARALRKRVRARNARRLAAGRIGE
jgi:hypothetical protein